MRATWLVRLYPREWRERYGPEMSAMLAEIPLTPASLLDLVAGAIDARIAPQIVPGRTSAAPSAKEKAMFSTVMKRCALGPTVTPQDRWMSSTIMLASSVLFAGLYVLATYAYPGNDLVEALGIMAFPAAMFLSMPFTYLKGHSTVSQVIIVSGSLLLLAGVAVLAARL